MAVSPDFGIDLNRGVRKQYAKESNIEVYMYKDDPGVFLDRSGEPLSEAIAADAGFDIESLKKKREKMEKMRSAIEQIEKEYGDGFDDYERGGLKIVRAGENSDRFRIADKDGAPFSNKDFTYQGAKEIIDRMAGPESKKPGKAKNS